MLLSCSLHGEIEISSIYSCSSAGIVINKRLKITSDLGVFLVLQDTYVIKYAVNINIRHHQHYILRYSLLRGTMVSRVVCCVSYCVSASQEHHFRRYSLRWLVPFVVLDEVGLHGALDALAVLVRGRRRRGGGLELVGEAVRAYPADEAVLQLVDVLGRLLHHFDLRGKFHTSQMVPTEALNLKM